ncbi:hypothetical protein BpHYR1_009409 [Brachionus plicatilis]|uniref:Uncharacterized protein n=1 Tax=Brachionus plicatilis TaxID=10195 RepID=A0A3M7RLY5_BRAPC|nr:hypothetical protein BpHYR1_009409 [Brachionus plicatilis]
MPFYKGITLSDRKKQRMFLSILEESIKNLNQLNFDHLIMIMNLKLPISSLQIGINNRPEFLDTILNPCFL